MTTWRETYINIAVAFDLSMREVPEDIGHLRTALDAIVDLTTENDGSDYGFGVESSVILLKNMNRLYNSARHFYIYDEKRRAMIRDFNDFTIASFDIRKSFSANACTSSLE